MRENRQYSSFRDWLISPVASVFSQTAQLYSSWLKKSVHCACMSCFPYLCACWWAPRLGYDLVVVTSDVVSVDVQGSLWDADLEVSEQTTRRSLGSVEYLRSFWETFILIAIVAGWVYIPRSSVCFLLSTSLPTSAIFLMTDILIGMESQGSLFNF